MKLIFITLNIVLFTSCNPNSQKVIIDKDKLENSEILDSWAMCATSNNGIMNQMNSCATITFMKNGVGFVIKNTLIAESFSWSLQKASMKIIYKNNSANSTFQDTFYYASFYKEKNVLNLTLRHNDNFFYLSRFTK